MKAMFKSAFGALLVVLALCGLTAASALAAGAPIVETKPATGLLGKSATLNGTINTNGATTKYYFEYGLTTSYGSRTAEGGLISGTKAYNVSKVAGGLSESTAYHFRLVASNSYGTVHGADETFTTAEFEPPEFRFNSEKYSGSVFTVGKTNATWSMEDGDYNVTCNSASMTGEIAAETRHGGKTVKNARILFKECSYYGEQCPTGENEPKGQLRSEPLEGTLVYLSKTAKTVGIDFRPQSGTTVATFKCVGGKAEIRGSVVMPITPVNTKENTFALESELKSEEFENEAGGKETAVLETNWYKEFFPMYWSINGTVKLEEQLEIIA